MQRPTLYETTYAHDRRAHRHRCWCCRRIINAGESVVMWKVAADCSRAMHAGCADRPSFDGLTQRQLAQLHSDEYARRLGFKVASFIGSGNGCNQCAPGSCTGRCDEIRQQVLG